MIALSSINSRLSAEETYTASSCRFVMQICYSYNDPPAASVVVEV